MFSGLFDLDNYPSTRRNPRNQSPALSNRVGIKAKAYEHLLIRHCNIDDGRFTPGIDTNSNRTLGEQFQGSIKRILEMGLSERWYHYSQMLWVTHNHIYSRFVRRNKTISVRHPCNTVDKVELD
jgi:hypothetical protein